jgi:hypothetical protein
MEWILEHFVESSLSQDAQWSHSIHEIVEKTVQQLTEDAIITALEKGKAELSIYELNLCIKLECINENNQCIALKMAFIDFQGRTHIVNTDSYAETTSRTFAIENIIIKYTQGTPHEKKYTQNFDLTHVAKALCLIQHDIVTGKTLAQAFAEKQPHTTKTETTVWSCVVENCVAVNVGLHPHNLRNQQSAIAGINGSIITVNVAENTLDYNEPLEAFITVTITPHRDNLTAQKRSEKFANILMAYIDLRNN